VQPEEELLTDPLISAQDFVQRGDLNLTADDNHHPCTEFLAASETAVAAVDVAEDAVELAEDAEEEAVDPVEADQLEV
jgi:hypothetical protein